MASLISQDIKKSTLVKFLNVVVLAAQKLLIRICNGEEERALLHPPELNNSVSLDLF